MLDKKDPGQHGVEERGRGGARLGGERPGRAEETNRYESELTVFLLSRGPMVFIVIFFKPDKSVF
jgi:hypothetical protein